MNKLALLFKSRQFWTIVVLFTINGFNGIQSMIPAEFLPLLNGALGLLSVYFRVSPKQKF